MKMVALYKDPRGLMLFTKTRTCTAQGISRISHYPTITDIGTAGMDEEMQGETQEKITKYTKERTSNVDSKETKFLAHGDDTVGKEIAPTVQTTSQTCIEEMDNTCTTPGSGKHIATASQDKKTEHTVAEDVNISTVHTPAGRKGISWQPQRKT